MQYIKDPRTRTTSADKSTKQKEKTNIKGTSGTRTNWNNQQTPSQPKRTTPSSRHLGQPENERKNSKALIRTELPVHNFISLMELIKIHTANQGK